MFIEEFEILTDSKRQLLFFWLLLCCAVFTKDSVASCCIQPSLPMCLANSLPWHRWWWNVPAAYYIAWINDGTWKVGEGEGDWPGPVTAALGLMTIIHQLPQMMASTFLIHDSNCHLIVWKFPSSFKQMVLISLTVVWKFHILPFICSVCEPFCSSSL